MNDKKNYELIKEYNLTKSNFKKGIKNIITIKHKIEIKIIIRCIFKNKKLYKIKFCENIIVFVIFLILSFLLCLTKEIRLRKIISSTEITITIKGTGEQKILSDGMKRKDSSYFMFNLKPNKIYINGILQSYTGKKVYNLTETINNVTMLWNNNLDYTYCMFYNVKNIIKVDLSKFNSSGITKMFCMFDSCNSLTSIDFTNFDTSSVTDMWGMFYNCKSLTSIDLSNFNTESLVDMTNIFYGCQSLNSIDLSNFNTPKLEYMKTPFYNCHELKYVNLTGINTSLMTNMSYFFYGCNQLTSVDLSGFQTSKVEYMNYMFKDCFLLTSINLKNFNT